MSRFTLIPPILSRDLQESSEELFTILDSLVLRVNSTCQAKISGGATPAITYGENVSSAVQDATGIYTVTLAIAYQDADQFMCNVTPVDSSPTDLKATITATTASTVTVKVTDSANAATDPEHLMIYTYGVQ